MHGVLGSFTSLPNLHPAVVHFPIALWTVAVGVDLASLLVSRRPRPDRLATILYLLGAVSAGAAYLAGTQAEDGLRGVPAAVQPVLARHADRAMWTLLTLPLVAAARGAAVWWSHRRKLPRPLVLRGLEVLAAVAGLGLLVVTADLGGALVYRYGVAVQTGIPAGGTAAAGLMRQEDGTLAWSPAPGDDVAVGTVLSLVEGTPVTVPIGGSRPTMSRAGLPIEVRGPAMLALPGEFDDVEVEALLDLADFEGTVGIAHHIQGPGTAGLFLFTTKGEAVLAHRAGGRDAVLNQGSAGHTRTPVTLTLSAVGTHIKGMVDGTVVVHGHERKGPPGRAGLHLQGSGVIRVLSVRITPLVDH